MSYAVFGGIGRLFCQGTKEAFLPVNTFMAQYVFKQDKAFLFGYSNNFSARSFKELYNQVTKEAFLLGY